MLCSTYRIKCETCECLLKERCYLLKYMKKFHSDHETVTKRGTDSMPAVVRDDSNEKRQVDSQDFGEDPENRVCEMGMDIGSKDSRNFRDITLGKMVRKATRPVKVYVP